MKVKSFSDLVSDFLSAEWESVFLLTIIIILILGKMSISIFVRITYEKMKRDY